MRVTFKKGESIRSYDVRNGRVAATIMLNSKWVSNPTLEQFKSDGWSEYVAPEPTPYVPTYEERVVALIREKYSMDDEFAILRQRDVKAEEFAEYNSYCELCKTKAKEEV